MTEFDQNFKTVCSLNHGLTQISVSSVAQFCPILRDPMDCSTPGFPVHHQLPELAQTHLHQVGDAIQPSIFNRYRKIDSNIALLDGAVTIYHLYRRLSFGKFRNNSIVECWKKIIVEPILVLPQRKYTELVALAPELNA